MAVNSGRLVCRRALSGCSRFGRVCARTSVLSLSQIRREARLPRRQLSVQQSRAYSYAPERGEVKVPHRFEEERRIRTEDELQGYYTPRPGSVLSERYQIIGKLACRLNSSHWLCKDLNKDDEFVMLKIGRAYSAYPATATEERDRNPTYSERAMYDRMKEAHHQGSNHVQDLKDAFTLSSRGRHWVCLVQEPLGIMLSDLQEYCPRRKLPLDILKPLMKQILGSLDLLHTGLGVMHGDLTPRNIHFRPTDPETFQRFEEREMLSPALTKVVHDIFREENHLYLSRQPPFVVGPLGEAVLCNFDLSQDKCSYFDSRWDHDSWKSYQTYWAPEVYLDNSMSSSTPKDHRLEIWALGCMAWHLAQGQLLFKGGMDIEQNWPPGYCQTTTLWETVQLIGTPSPKFMNAVPGCVGNDFHPDGELIDNSDNFDNWYVYEEPSFDNLNVKWDVEERDLFIEFLKRMIRWVPEERATAAELLEDPWFQTQTRSTRTSEDPLTRLYLAS